MPDTYRVEVEIRQIQTVVFTVADDDVSNAFWAMRRAEEKARGVHPDADEIVAKRCSRTE